MVNSYISINPFAADYTRYHTYRQDKTVALEFAMHKIWRCNAQKFDLGSGQHPWPTVDQVIERLTKANEELNQCRDILMEKTSDRVGFYDGKNQKMDYIEEPAILFKKE